MPLEVLPSVVKAVLYPPIDEDPPQFHPAILKSIGHPVPEMAHHNPAKESVTNLLDLAMILPNLFFAFSSVMISVQIAFLAPISFGHF